MLDLMARGGPFMWLVLFLFVVAICVGVVSVILAIAARRSGAAGAAKVLAIVALAVCLLPAVVGAVGWGYGFHLVQEALLGADPAMRVELQARGLQAAALSLYFGLGASGVALLPAVVGAALVPWRRRSGQHD
ncbi:hypothetical protein ACFL6C_14545 [Myxococcota bacterium]